jgi:hypothetical protein
MWYWFPSQVGASWELSGHVKSVLQNFSANGTLSVGLGVTAAALAKLLLRECMLQLVTHDKKPFQSPVSLDELRVWTNGHERTRSDYYVTAVDSFNWVRNMAFCIRYTKFH